MQSKKHPRHILPTLISLVLVLGLNVSCTDESGQKYRLREGALEEIVLWLVSPEGGGNHVRKTDSSGNEAGAAPTLKEFLGAGAVIPIDVRGVLFPGFLRVGLTVGGTDDGAERAIDVAAEEPRVILVGSTTAQILNLGTNTLGAQVPLSGQFGFLVAVSADGAFAAVVAGQSNGPGLVNIIDLSSMTQTGAIALPPDCKARGIAFLPGTNDFAAACSGDGAVRFYSVNGGAGSGLIREFTGCEGARAVAFTADGQRGLFSCTSSVWVYDVLSDSVVHKIEGFDGVQAMATTMDATRAYVTNTGDGFAELIVVDLTTYGIVGTTEVGGFPGTVVVGPDDLRVYVLGAREGEGRGVVITDKQGVELGFAPAPDSRSLSLLFECPPRLSRGNQHATRRAFSPAVQNRRFAK